MDRRPRDYASDSKLVILTPSEHHLQLRQDGKVFAEWWPSKGTTMTEGRRGRRCRTVAEFIDWLNTI